jgi:hypothetical protein
MQRIISMSQVQTNTQACFLLQYTVQSGCQRSKKREVFFTKVISSIVARSFAGSSRSISLFSSQEKTEKTFHLELVWVFLHRNSSSYFTFCFGLVAGARSNVKAESTTTESLLQNVVKHAGCKARFSRPFLACTNCSKMSKRRSSLDFSLIKWTLDIGLI